MQSLKLTNAEPSCIFISFLRKLAGHGASIDKNDTLAKTFGEVSSSAIQDLFPEFLPKKEEARGKLTKFVEGVNTTLYTHVSDTPKEVYAICDRDL